MVEMREKRAERQAAKEAAGGREGRGRRRRRTPSGAEAPKAPRRRPRRARRAAEEARADHGAYQAGPLAPDLERRRVFITLEGIDRCGQDDAGGAAGRGAGPRDPAAARARRHAGRRADPRAAQGPRARARRPGPSCCSSAPPARSSPRSVIAPGASTPAATSSATASSTRPSPTRASRAASASTSSSGSTRSPSASCVPDLTVLLRVDSDRRRTEAGPGSRPARATGADRFEAEGVEFQRAVAAAYDELAAAPSGPDRGRRRRAARRTSPRSGCIERGRGASR